MSISRRSCLIGGASLFGWLVAPKVARQIIHMAQEHERILEVPIHRPDRILYAHDCGTLSLDCIVDEPPETLTWRQWLEIRSCDPEDPDAVYQCFVDNCFCEPWEGFEDGDSNPDEYFKMPDLNAKITDAMMWDYLDWEYSSSESPEACAFSYLENLGLGAAIPSDPFPLGELQFLDGPCPGNNSRIVQATSLEAISGLQQRLIQLGQNVQVMQV